MACETAAPTDSAAAPATQAVALNRIEVAVVMRREPVTGPMSRWQSWRWLLADVLSGETLAQLQPLPDPPGPLPLEALAGGEGGEGASHWLYHGLGVELHRDDAEGYRLNLESPQPCFWVMWRPDEVQLLNGEAAPLPLIVTLSYQDAGRWLDAQERVEQVTPPAEVVASLARHDEAHLRPEPRRRQRPASFQPLSDRFGNPVSISTGARRGRGGQGHDG